MTNTVSKILLLLLTATLFSSCRHMGSLKGASGRGSDEPWGPGSRSENPMSGEDHERIENLLRTAERVRGMEQNTMDAPKLKRRATSGGGGERITAIPKLPGGLVQISNTTNKSSRPTNHDPSKTQNVQG